MDPENLLETNHPPKTPFKSQVSQQKLKAWTFLIILVSGSEFEKPIRI